MIPTPGSQSQPRTAPAERSRNYVLLILTLIFACSQLDRMALGLVLQDLKLEFALSDTQIGLLTGFAYSLFFASLGIPLARWADRGNRVTIISVTAAIWSVAVAALAFVGNFWQLVLARVGAAVGEAGCVPPANSLLADYFPRGERARAMSRYALATPIAIVFGTFAAGWINEFFGWRAMFLVLSLPGPILAAIVALTIADPRISRALDIKDQSNPARMQSEVSLKTIVTTLWENKSFRRLLIFWVAVQFAGAGISQWLPAFVVRSYGLSTGELGTWLSAIYGVGGALGAYLGGELVTRYASGNESLQVKLVALAYGVFGILSIGSYLARDQYITLALTGIAVVFLYTTLGPMSAFTQSLVPERMRATALALLFFVTNLVGYSLGPLAVGAFSDALTAALGQDALRYALVAMCLCFFPACWYFWGASRTIANDLELVHRGNVAALKSALIG